MSTITSEINRIKTNINDSLDAVAAYGVEIQEGDNSDNLSARIAEIGNNITWESINTKDGKCNPEYIDSSLNNENLKEDLINLQDQLSFSCSGNIVGGYEMVDLGLPSGLLWASCNIGAAKPCDGGLLFQFGRVDGYTYGDTNHQFRTVDQNYTDTGNLEIPATTSGKTYGRNAVLDPVDDAAYVATDGKLRMPTVDEIDELLLGTTNEWCQCSVLGGEHAEHTVYGRLFTSKSNSDAKIFIPTSGYFDGIHGKFESSGASCSVVSSQVCSNVTQACNLYFDSSYCNYDEDSRCSGFPVRGVCSPDSLSKMPLKDKVIELDERVTKIQNSGKVTIDGLVKQEFGEVVSTEYYGMTMQGILTNIPAQEGVSFKLSNIHYEDDIHYYDTSGSEGTPEAVYAKDDANRVTHYPTELSGVLEYHQGALGYSEEFDSTGLHALVDFGLDYMVYVDNFGFELSTRPLISYPLKLEVSSLISPDYIESSLGNANLKEDIKALSEKKATWDDLANGETIHCDEYVSFTFEGQIVDGVKVPIDPATATLVTLKNVTIVGESASFGGMSAEDVSQMCGFPRDLTYRIEKYDWGYVGICDEKIVADGEDEISAEVFAKIMATNGMDYFLLHPYNELNDGNANGSALVVCDLVQDASLCPQDYVASSLGNANLKEDIKALSEKETTWDDLYGGEKHLTHNEVFDVSDPTLGNIKLMGLRLYSNPKEGDVVSVKNVCFTGDIEYDYEGEHFTYSPSDYMRPKDYEFTLVSSGGLLMALSEDNNNFVIQGNDGNLYLVHGLVLEVFGQQSAQHPNIYDNMVLPYECDYIASSPCPPSYVASSIGNESLEEDIKFLKENSGKSVVASITYNELKSLRDNSKLVSGTWYRITDYECETFAENTQSARHQFDILVLAVSNNELNENALACHHDGDEYFKNNNLNAWRLKYELDASHDWAKVMPYFFVDDDSKYVRYPEKDRENEYAWCYEDPEGEVNYDNIVYTSNIEVEDGDTVMRYDEEQEIYNSSQGGTASKGCVYWLCDEFENECGYDFKNIQFKRKRIENNIVDSLVGKYSVELSKAGTLSNNFVWCYTFNSWDEENDEIENGDSSLKQGVYMNKLIGKGTFNNVFFGNTCRCNTFGTNCYNNTFGNNCCCNTFGINCHYNIFGNTCHDNTFGNNLWLNVFGDSCQNNTFGDCCNNNTFGVCFNFNTFGNYCQDNMFGNHCYYITFGNKCCRNTFGSSSSMQNYMCYVTLDNDVQYTYINCSATTSLSSYGQNIHVSSGVHGTSNTNRKTLTIATAGNKFLTTFKSANDTEITV